jgi:cytochrome c oxidase subunit 3
MTDVSGFDQIPLDLKPASPARPRLLVTATALASAAVVMMFAGLLGAYISHRADVIAIGETWLPSGVVIPLTQPNMMMITMVFSAVIMTWALSSIRNDDRPNTFIALGLCIVFALAFISQTGFLLNLMDLPLSVDFAAGDTIDEWRRAPLFYSIIGAHIVMVLAAMIYLVVMGFRTLGGQYNARNVEGLYAAALFWYVTVGVYLVIWYTIYITK